MDLSSKTRNVKESFKRVRSSLIICMALTLSILFFNEAKESLAMGLFHGLLGKYEWLASESADARFPIQIIKGDLIYKNGKSLYIPNRKVVHNRWGKWYSTHIVGPDYKPLPEKLEITWFSYIENMFYYGLFDLPYETIERCFERGIDPPQDKDGKEYRRIVVGLGPKGTVVVWLSGGYGETKEMAVFKAEEAEVPWKAVVDNPDLTRDEFIERILNNHIGPEQVLASQVYLKRVDFMERHKTKYNYGVHIKGNSIPDDMWLMTFNGESEHIDYVKGHNTETRPRSVATEISVNWDSPTHDRKYNAKILFDEEEMFKAFAKLYQSNPDDPLSLQIEIDEIAAKVSVALTNSKYLLELEKAGIEIGGYDKR